MKLSNDQKNYIIKEYIKGKSQKDLAIEFNTYNTSIRRILIKNGISIRGNNVIQSYVKHNYFKNLKDPNTQYWLGWLATDGCLTNGNIVLEVKEEDSYILEYFKDFLGNSVNINKQLNKKFNCYLYRISFKNKEIYEFLKVLGITERKSLTLQLNIPITFSMLRGILDGDGSVKSKNRDVSIYSCSKLFINQIYDFLKTEGFSPKLNVDIKKRKNPFYRINLHKREELIRLYNLMYQDHCICLKRKQSNFGSSIGKLIE